MKNQDNFFRAETPTIEGLKTVGFVDLSAKPKNGEIKIYKTEKVYKNALKAKAELSELHKDHPKAKEILARIKGYAEKSLDIQLNGTTEKVFRFRKGEMQRLIGEATTALGQFKYLNNVETFVAEAAELVAEMQQDLNSKLPKNQPLKGKFDGLIFE